MTINLNDGFKKVVFVGNDVYGVDERVSKLVASKILGVSQSTLNRFVKAGEISFYKFGKNQQSKIVFLVADLLDFIAGVGVAA